jgi:rare lipoprotein A
MMKHIILSLILCTLCACAASNTGPARAITYVDPVALGTTSDAPVTDTETEALPADPYVEPADPYVDPYEEPIDPYEEPIEPYVAPVEPYVAPVEPTVTVVETPHISDTGIYPEDIQEAPVTTGTVKTGKPYVIKGITYYPLESLPADYEEVGIASWYGEEFHGKKTANGEIFDMYALSAAHKTLPMPTYVHVTNLENGKEVVVRVNDRGPFSKGRIIDLSYAAAEEIDMLAQGTAKVRIAVLSQATESLTTDNVPENINTGLFSVQIGSFKDKDNADRLAAEHQGGRVTEALVGGQTYYRVQVTGYSTMYEAEQAARLMLSEYPGAFVVRQ